MSNGVPVVLRIRCIVFFIYMGSDSPVGQSGCKLWWVYWPNRTNAFRHRCRVTTEDRL